MKKFLALLFLVIFLGIFMRFGQKKNNQKVNIYGVIIPHHAFAAEILNSSFQKLKSNINPNYVVIFGTNHYFPISETFTTTTNVKSEFDLKNFLASDERINGDHSIGTATPYVSKYFPNSKIIPIIVSGRYENLQYLKNVAAEISGKFAGKRVLYVASVDFAHNVSLSEGLKNNSESIESISNFNYEKILSYKDDHMDSPTAITTFLLVMQNLGATKWSTWYSSHGALISGNIGQEGTSYVVGVFDK